MGPVVWALDAFSKDFDVHFRTAEAIRAHAPESDIHPVYVLSEEVFGRKGYSSFLRPALKPRAHRNLQAVLDHELMASVRASGRLRQPEVLIESSAEAQLCVGKLLRYAHSIGSRLVALGTHSRSKLSRFFAGSFTETLLNERAIDVLVTGPRQLAITEHPSAIITPTMFSDGEHVAFAHLLEFVRLTQAPLTLYHRENDEPADLYGESWLSMFEDGTVASRGEDWLNECRQQGVDTQLITENFRESHAQSIIDYARTVGGSAPLIAMLELTPMVKDLIRASPFPVLMVT